jgi:drug/metabolite transporter (DMT)-like permease
VGSFVFEALYSVLGKPIVLRCSVMKVLTISLLVGTAVNLLIDGTNTFAAARDMAWKGWALLVALAFVCTAVGYTLWFVVIRECPINVAALTVFAQSVFGVILAATWLGEPLVWGQILGSTIIVAGLVLGLSKQIKKAPPRPSNHL